MSSQRAHRLSRRWPLARARENALVAFDVAGVTTSVMLRPSLTINLLIILGMRELGFRAGVCHGRG
jgi:hypothetical protein